MTTAVVLFNLGAPDSLAAVEPFLRNLFSDPAILRVPGLVRPWLARLIARRRAPVAREIYARLGGGSPLLAETQKQAQALQASLDAAPEGPFRVFVAMRYWHPFTAEAVTRVRDAGCDELILLPLYPEYSSTTTGSSLNEWERRCRDVAYNPRSTVIRDYHRSPEYLDSLAGRIKSTFDRFGSPKGVHLIFSAHSVPMSVIQKGDPYQAHIEETVKLVMQRGGWANPYSLCYQSKVGNQKWLQPSLHETIERLGSEGTEKVLVVPVAFVSDHVETLAEIDIEAREEAAEHGIGQFEMMPGLNDDPSFIRALATLVYDAAGLASAQPASPAVAAAG
jgi:ferrochelatase